MSRTKLRDRVLPRYTRGEEIMNMVTHIVGGGLGVLVLVACVLLAAHHQNAVGIVCGAVYGVSMITLYTMSSIYHGLRINTAKKVFQILDHCTIYFLIAGTYTPMLLCGLVRTAPIAAYVLLAVVWVCTTVAVTLTAIDLRKYRAFGMACYIGIGWVILFSIWDMYLAIGPVGFALLLGGGILYTLGVAFFRAGNRVPYLHAVFHLFVLAGSLLHAACVLLCLM